MGTFRTRPEWYGKREGTPGTTPSPYQRPAAPSLTPSFHVGKPWTPETDYERETGQKQPDVWLPCGGQRGPLRCGRPLAMGSVVCAECSLDSARQLFADSDRFRDWCAEQITDEEYERGQVRVATSRSEQRKARAADREASAVHVVYYLRVAADRIKIGTTGDLVKRLAGLYTDASALLAVEPGDRTVEKRRHRQWAQWRTHTHREAFHDTPELLAFIAAVRAEHGDPSDYLHRSPDEEVS